MTSSPSDRPPLFIDFETYSEADVRKVGAWRYAEHPTTEVLCMAYAFGDEPVQLWRPGQPFPQRVLNHVNAHGVVVAHNVEFELAIWNEVLTHAVENSAVA